MSVFVTFSDDSILVRRIRSDARYAMLPVIFDDQIHFQIGSKIRFADAGDVCPPVVFPKPFQKPRGDPHFGTAAFFVFRRILLISSAS